MPLFSNKHTRPKAFTKFWWQSIVHIASFGFLFRPRLSRDNFDIIIYDEAADFDWDDTEKIEQLMIYETLRP